MVCPLPVNVACISLVMQARSKMQRRSDDREQNQARYCLIQSTDLKELHVPLHTFILVHNTVAQRQFC